MTPKIPYNFRIDELLLDELNSFASKQNTTVSNVIRTSIYQHLREMYKLGFAESKTRNTTIIE
jgi:predicted DNA-binding protein